MSLYYKVRDGFRYDPFRINLSPEGMKPERVLENGYGWCDPRPRCYPLLAANWASRPGWASPTCAIT